jgi:error-prone DNA polymerase
MGFYQPAQLVRDAREHGVTVLPVDVNHSDYDCTLEDVEGGTGVQGARVSRDDDDPAHFGAGGPAVRLGMRLIRGVSAMQVENITRARREGPFISLCDLVRRSGAARATLARLAAADALASLSLDRRRALWEILALEDDPLPLFVAVEPVEPVPRLPHTSMMQCVTADYASVGLSLRSHPVALVRAELDRLGAHPARELRSAPQGRRLRVAGLVLVRQRPPTAKGILFCTLEDESGIANLIVRPEVFERYRREACTAVMLLAHGRVERQGEVVHLHVQRLSDLSHALREVSSQSRDFH